MKNNIKKYIKKSCISTMYYLPKKIAHEMLYYLVKRKKLNLNNPKDFNEKIQWLIVNEYGKREGKLADKYLVREYVSEKGLSNILPKLYGVYDHFKEIDFSKLPKDFVLKTNHGSGGVFICESQKDFNFKECGKALDKNLKNDFSKKNLEYHYKYIEPKIICEEYLKEESRKNPLDYKFYCFNGKVECVLVCSEREENLKLDYYDLDWNCLNYSKEIYRSEKKQVKPEKFEEMIKIAEILSKEFKFVRVDLYNINGKIYFGELTFTPAAGLSSTITDEAADYLGNLIVL